MKSKIKTVVFLIKRLLKENYKTIYFNFKYFPFHEAVKFPVIISKNVYFRQLKGSVTIDSPLKYGMVKIGFGRVGIFDDKFSRTILEISGKMIFKGSADIGHGSKISIAESGTIVFGTNFKITAESALVSFKKIEFGNNCLLSWDILVMDTDHHRIRNDKGEIINEPEEIIIGDKVWIGCRALILKGTVIPSNAVIGANSVVSKELDQEKALYAGIPAKLIKQNVTWE